jgi:hypothetical protein
MKRLFGLLLYVVLICLGSCSSHDEQPISENQVAQAWAQMTLFVAKNTPANTPTFASRSFGYIGLTMYESIVHGFPDHVSLSGQLNGLNGLPQPMSDKKYHWVLSLNAAEASILKNIYVQTSDENKSKIDSLEQTIVTQFGSAVDEEIKTRSIEYGKSIAEYIFNWSTSDGGHRGYLRNFDKKLIIEYKPGGWEPPLYGQTFSHFPLHPYWGKNRTFVVANSQMPVPEMLHYDTSKNSDYYKQFEHVYEKSKTLTEEEKETALWWNDDPNETFTPPGHYYYLALQVVKVKNCNLIESTETFARVGMAVADAFINCWKWKYHYVSERPSSFITRHIDQRWESFWPDPPFPAFPSGHATQAGAAVTVLADMHGEEISITDKAHENRPPDELRQVKFKPRSFTSFWQIAVETADSRFYGGIHSPQDNDVGLEQGKQIGQHVNQLQWHSKK